MKLATLANGHRDGRLLVVSPNLSRAEPAQAAATLQQALDDWDAVAPALTGQYRTLASGGGDPLDRTRLMSAMPRSYQFLDASAFLAHNHILADAWGYARRTMEDPPLMYQGMSDRFLAPSGELLFRSASDDVDFEAEFGIITDAVPRGTAPDQALGHVKLVVLINDWSLRAFGPSEMKAGFGFLHAKPPSALSPIAVTPDELGAAWHAGRIELALGIERNGERFGRPHGGEMSYGFDRLIAHAATTRDLCAGTVLGSGTVSNTDAAAAGSGCIAERRALDTIGGREATPFLQDGERVRIEAVDAAGRSIFGAIDHVVRLEQPG